MKAYDDTNIMETFVSRQRVFDGIILHIDHVTNRLPNGKEAKREVALHIGAAAVLPIDGEGFVYLVRQYRAPIDQILLEIPAGKLDAPDEDHLLAAKRELREETGFTAARFDHLCDSFTTPGFSSEKIAIFLARELSPGETDPDEDEFLNVVRMPFEEAYGMAVRGEINDAKTVIALTLAYAKIKAGD